MPNATETALLPNAEAGRSDGQGVTNADAWLRHCYWESPGQRTSTVLLPSLSLTVAGARTPEGASSLLLSPATNRGGTREVLEGVGDEAAYFDSQLSEVGIVANYGNYVVELDAGSFESPPSKGSILVLVQKIIGQLH